MTLAIRSLRGRLLVWYTGMLALIILVFGALVCFLAWRARVADVDQELSARAAALVRGLEPVAPGTFDLTLPDTEPVDPGMYHALWTDRGTPIDASDPELEIPVPAAPGVRTREGRRETVVRAPGGALVLVGVPLDGVRAEIVRLAMTMSLAGVAAIGVALIGGWWLVGRALAPVREINQTARAMAEGDFEARIAVSRVETELEQLAGALNQAFERLHASLERQRRFSADASHELRTPLATISTETQWALSRPRVEDDYRSSLDVCRRAAGRMQLVVERLLALARADALAVEPDLGPVALDALVADVVRDVRPLADARQLHIGVAASPVVCQGDRERLRDAITNVVVNAIAYNVDGGRIDLEVRTRGGDAEVVVADTGVGIAPEHLPYVFEPFFRGDPARSHDAGGGGLGLAVTRAIARQHGGDVTCDSQVGRGTTCTIRVAMDAPGEPA